MFKVGDLVSWTHVGKGRIVSMQPRQGVIESIEGNNAVIRKSNKRTETVALVKLRKPGQKSQLSEFVEAIVEANKK